MIADKIKEEIKLLSFEEIVDIAEYIDQLLREKHNLYLHTTAFERSILDERLDKINKNPEAVSTVPLEEAFKDLYAKAKASNPPEM